MNRSKEKGQMRGRRFGVGRAQTRALVEERSGLTINTFCPITLICGCRHRWPGCIELCDKCGIAWLMSKKARSLDKASCEVFFYRFNNGFFYYRDRCRLFEELSARLDLRSGYCSSNSEKKSLGRMRPTELSHITRICSLGCSGKRSVPQPCNSLRNVSFLNTKHQFTVFYYA